MDDLFTPGLKSKAKNAFAMSVPFLIMVFTIIYTFVTGGDATLSMTVNNIVSSVIFCLLVVFMYVSVFSNCVKTAEDKYADKYEAALKAYEDERRITVERDYTDIEKWIEQQMLDELEARRRRIVTPFVRYDVYLREYFGKTRKEVVAKTKQLPRRYRAAILKANRQRAKKCSSDFLLASNHKIASDVRDQKRYSIKIAGKTVGTLAPKFLLSFIATTITVVVYYDPAAAIVKLILQLISLSTTAMSAKSTADVKVQRETYLLDYKRELLHKFNNTERAPDVFTPDESEEFLQMISQMDQ